MITLNNAFEEELYFQYLRDPKSVSPEWQRYFQDLYKNENVRQENLAPMTSLQSSPVNAFTQSVADDGIKLNPEAKPKENYILRNGESLELLSSIQTKIAINMEESLEIPTATSVRTIPVKVLDENRRIINKYLTKLKREKVSFTHILLWAIVRALVRFPKMNDAFTRVGDKNYRISRKSINIGLAVDIEKKDGTRLLLVPNVKDAQNLHFSEFIEKFNLIIEKSRTNKLDVDDLSGTTITLTNPGMIGTTFSSPRLMKGQGLIIGIGSIDYPTEFMAVRPELLTTFAVSKVITITSTYDHRIIQGAESAEFLAYLNRLLVGEDLFYDQIFVSLRIPFEPIRWSVDAGVNTQYGLFDVKESVEKGAHVMLMINAYRVRGHLLASTNPLGLATYYYPELDPAYYGFTIWDLDRIFHADDSWEKNNLPLRDIIELLRDTYCGAIGIEFMHIQAQEKKEWIKKNLEVTRTFRNFTKEDRITIYKKLVEAEFFENYLHTKFVGHKRFSLEGSESVIVLLDKILENASDNKLHSAILGMAHRGRLNVLVNIIGKSYEQVFDEFEDQIDPSSYHGSGDVKYHLGDWGFYISRKNNSISVILAPNPSHLELVNPVIEGMARALDNEIKDQTHTKALPILIHGDAAFAGQGIVAETLNLSQLQGYKTGGTIHIVINNQIGFTTSSHDARSSVYATDVAKMIQAPIIHVNGNDPEAVQTAAIIACEYRANFKGDIIIDLLSYRKYGHNESDEPTYTQPLLYKKIKSMKPVREIYETELIKDKVFSADEARKYQEITRQRLDDAFSNRKDRQKKPANISKLKPGQIFQPINTALAVSTMDKITNAISTVPDGFKANPKIIGLLDKRAAMMKSDKPMIDWAMAEALAFGAILLDGQEIRFSGQDSRRGTFSQRHAVLTDIVTEDDYIPLNHIEEGQPIIRIYDSPLSEIGVLGFEYGYSVIATNSLTLWEAQFGDFSNGAQALIDQFISSAEIKWAQSSNLVMLLPHGYDGQGPEHSSARLERFLQLCAQDNIFVLNLSTPAQYFHALRRQVIMPYKKPAVLMTPKSMLRHPMAVSAPNDLSNGGFQHIIDDQVLKSKEKVRRILFCTGKVCWDLISEQLSSKQEDVAVVRIEQLYPLDIKLLLNILSTYPDDAEIAWVQEEPKNMGAWSYIFMSFSEFLEGRKIKFFGRKDGASPASGSFKIHIAEQKKLVEDAFRI